MVAEEQHGAIIQTEIYMTSISNTNKTGFKQTSIFNSKLKNPSVLFRSNLPWNRDIPVRGCLLKVQSGLTKLSFRFNVDIQQLLSQCSTVVKIQYT